MAYTTTIQGITVVSNIPFDQPVPSGSLYEVDLHFTLPIAQIELLGYDLQHLLGEQSFIDALVQQGWTGSIKTYNVYVVDDFTLRVAFIASSPLQYAVLAAVVVIVIVIGATLISYFTSTVSNSPGGQALGIGLGIAIAGVAIIGAGVFGYSFFKSREFRQETVKSATAGLRYARETVAPAVTRSASQAASYASRGVQLLRSPRSPESEEP